MLSRWRIKSLSIKSKFLLMMLGVSVVSLVVISLLAFFRTGDALSNSAVERLTNQRTTQAARLTEHLETIERQAKTLSADRMIIEAMLEFRIGFDQLDSVVLDGETTSTIESTSRDYYNAFLADVGADTSPESIAFHQPASQAGRYLQSLYVTSQGVGSDAAEIDSTGDNTFYDRSHQRFHPILRDYIDTFGYYDIFLIDATTSSIVYSAEKKIDFGTDLARGPYANTPLGAVINSAVRQAEPTDVSFADFEFYRPSSDAPASFVASPIVSAGKVIGILALQLSTDEIDRVMTVDEDWNNRGFGQTGETYVVGPDQTMRSKARLMIETPDEFLRQLTVANVSESAISAIRDSGSTALTQPVQFSGISNALIRGRTDTSVITNYRGTQVLASYGPVDFDKLNWVLVAEIELDEARDAQRSLQRELLAAAGVIVLIVTALAGILAARFTGPISRLTRWAEAIADGDTSAGPPVHSDDEFGELANSIGRMHAGLLEQTNIVEQQNAENERLLTTLMPASVAERLRRGEENIADEHPDAVVIVLRIMGLSDVASKLNARDTVEMINQLVSAFDDAAETLHVEKIRTVSDTYLAAVGLSERRLDQPRMAVEFVLEAMKAVERYVAGSDMPLGLRAGISGGPVESGLIGRTKPVFEIVGGPVDAAVELAAQAVRGQILVTTTIKDRLEDTYSFSGAEAVELSDKMVEVWDLHEQAEVVA